MHLAHVTAVLWACVCVFAVPQADALSDADYFDLLSTLNNDGPNHYWPKREAVNSLFTDSSSSNSSDTASLLMHHLTKRQAGSGGTILENKSFGECVLPTGDKGTCRQVAFCPLPEIKNDVYRLLSQLCTIKETNAIGICCPDQFRSRSGPQVITSIDDNTLEQARIVNKPEQRGCGLTTKQFPRITGGRPAEPGEWPWMVALIRAREQFVWCGGVLVTDRHVLTAAHCLHKQDIPNMFVRLGEYNTHNLTETRARDFKISAMVLHADYDPMTYENDIALVRVDRAALFNTYIWPICLPPLGENWEGRTAVVTGWGTTKFGGMHSSILMEAALPVWKHEECKKSLVMRIPDTTMCAGAPEGGQDSCQGDSGGPLMYQLPNNRWITIAIVSWGIRCGEPDHPGIYTRVDKYMNWIIQNSNI